MKKRTAAIILITILLIIIGVGTAFAESMPGRVEGTGTHFQLTDSAYLNVTLDSTESIYVFLESVPETVSIQIEPVSTAAQTEITLGGLAPSTTYYKYEDNYYNLQTFTTDQQGRFSYIQDISQAHLVFVQPRTSTIHLSLDGWSDPAVGTWDSNTKTARLTTDLTEMIQIQDDGITLLGDGHSITGTFSGHGIFINGHTNIKVKNVKIKNFSHGIYLFNSTGITIRNAILESNTNGLYLKGSTNVGSDNNKVYNNSFISNNIQAYIDSNSDNNIFNLHMPTAGNYWNNFTSPDDNGDRIVDEPYPFYGVTDNLPWICKDGWIPITTLSTSPISPDGNDGWFKSTPTITLTSNEPGVTYYSWDSANGPWTTYTGSFSVSDGTKTLYYYSVDTDDNAEAVKSQTIKVDTTPASIPTLSASAISGTQIQLSWPASTDGLSGVRQYQIFNAATNSLIATTQTTSYVHGGLTNGQTYSYYIKVIDQAGNISGISNIANVTTFEELSALIDEGTNVEVSLGDSTTLLFDQVTSGQILVTETPPETLPPGYRLISNYDITTSSTYGGSIKITLPYNPDKVFGQEEDVRLFHWEHNSWVDITESVDMVNKTVTGTTVSFSPFIVVEPGSASPAVGGVAGRAEFSSMPYGQ